MESSLLSAKHLIQYLREKKVLKIQALPEEMIFYFSSTLPAEIEQKFEAYESFLGAKLFKMDKAQGLLMGFGIGAPSAVCKLEEVRELGVKKIILVGSAGAISSDLKIGDILLIDKASSEEGTSRLYSESEQEQFFADPKLLDSISTRLKSAGIQFKKTATWTTDAPYRETSSKLKHFLEKSAEVVDMEASAVFAAAERLGIQAAAVFVVSDRVLASGWEPGFGSKLLKNSRAAVLKALL